MVTDEIMHSLIARIKRIMLFVCVLLLSLLFFSTKEVSALGFSFETMHLH